MNFVRSQAEVGRSRSQTQLGDYYLARSEYTNAVGWYKKAAEQNDISAQLTLAGCFVSGLGVEKNPGTAAEWLRKAATLLEMRSTNRLLQTRHAIIESTQPPLSQTNIPGPTANAVYGTNNLSIPKRMPTPGDSNVTSLAGTNFPKVDRIDTLLVAEPDLQNVPPGLREPSESR